jgi:uncharacterized protein YgiM (DUF1202 family)
MKTIDVTYRMKFGDDGILRSMETISEKVISNGAIAYATEPLNVRNAPVNGAVIGGLRDGQRVTVLERKDLWARIMTDSGLTGWSSEQYLKFEAERP